MATLVRHVMTEAPRTLRIDATASDAARLMADADVGAVPVVEADGRLAGLVTDRDLVLRVVAREADPSIVTLGEVVTTALVAATPDMGLSEAREMMGEYQVRRLPVLKGDELVGIVSIGDVAVASASDREVGETLEEISRSERTEHENPGPDRGTPERVRAHGAHEAARVTETEP
jgi:CBS domain-containing protein